MMLILVTCFVMEAVFSAPAASHQLVPDGLSLFMTPNDMDKLSKATQELENVFKMIRRRKRSLSSFYIHILHDKRKESTTPYYSDRM